MLQNGVLALIHRLSTAIVNEWINQLTQDQTYPQGVYRTAL